MLYNSIGASSINLGEYEESHISFKLAMEMLKNYKNDERFEEKFGNSSLQLSNSFHSVGKYFIAIGLFEENLPYLDAAFKTFEAYCYDFDDDDKALQTPHLSTKSVSHLKNVPRV